MTATVRMPKTVPMTRPTTWTEAFPAIFRVTLMWVIRKKISGDDVA
jgi:hypothetical protein